MPSRQHGANPNGEPTGLPLEPLHVGPCALDEQTPDILVATFADAEQVGFAAGALLPWHQPDRCGEVPAAVVLLAVADLGSQHACGDRADARYRQKAGSSSASCRASSLSSSRICSLRYLKWACRRSRMAIRRGSSKCSASTAGNRVMTAWPIGKLMPNSSRKSCIWLMVFVRSRTSDSRTRCNADSCNSLD
jgi:hypothetical protein